MITFEREKLLDLMLSRYSSGARFTFSEEAKRLYPNISAPDIRYAVDRLMADGMLVPSKFGEAEPYTLTPKGRLAAEDNHYATEFLEKRSSKRHLRIAAWASVIAALAGIAEVVWDALR